MNRIIFCLAALLITAQVQAATFFTNFESVPYWTQDSDPNLCRHLGSQVGQGGTMTIGGITATFGSSFAWSRALTEAPSIGCSYYGGAIDADFGAAAVGLYRNAPSGTKCARVCWDCTWNADIDSRSIKFSPAVHYVSFYCSGSVYQDAWACGSPYLLRFDGSVHDFNVHAIDENHGGSVGGTYHTFELWQGGTIRATRTPQAVDGFAGACYTPVPDMTMDYTHVHDPYCNWQFVEIYSASPIDRLYFRNQTSYYDPFYLDDLTVSDGACAYPPCQFERAQMDRELAIPAASLGEPQPIPTKLLVNHATPTTRTSWGGLKGQYYR